MKNLLKSELYVLKVFLELPMRKLLNHKFEMEEDYIYEHVAGFIEGERYENEIVAFSKEEFNIYNCLILKNFDTDDGKDLLTSYLLTKAVCNIMNKYKKI